MSSAQFIVNILINKPAYILLPAFLFLLCVLLWEGVKQKNGRIAMMVWRTFSILSLLSFTFFGIGFWTSLPWFGDVFAVVWIILSFAAVWILKDKRQSAWLVSLSVASFVIPLIGLFSYCLSSALPIVAFMSDGQGTTSCMYGITAMNLGQVVIEFFLSIFLLISAIIIQRRSTTQNPVA